MICIYIYIYTYTYIFVYKRVGEGGGCLAPLNYIYSKLILPSNNTPSHFGKRGFFWNKYTVLSNDFKQRPTSKKISNQECFKNISWSPEDHIFYYT